MAQDDYYYEIQLTNKQLVFYFMAGAAGLILSFLAGVMVGRGIDAGASGARRRGDTADRRGEGRHRADPRPGGDGIHLPAAARVGACDRGAREAGFRVVGAGPGVDPPERPRSPRPCRSTPRRPLDPQPPARPAATPARPAATPVPATPRPPVLAPALPRAIGSNANVKGFAVQVGAFKDRASADTVVKSLKGRGLPAFAVAPAGGGLYTVRVGVYRDRADAESVQDRLRDDKFKPYIIKQ